MKKIKVYQIKRIAEDNYTIMIMDGEDFEKDDNLTLEEIFSITRHLKEEGFSEVG